MYLYKISQSQDNGYDTFSSAIVIAESIESAREMIPNFKTFNLVREDHDGWADKAHVEVQLLGVASQGSLRSLVLSSFRAG